MKSEKDKIKDIFSSKLNNFEVDLPPSLWEKIDADLHLAKPLSKPAKKKYVLYRYAALVASVAAILVVLFLLNIETPTEQNQNLAKTQLLPDISLDTKILENENSQIIDNQKQETEIINQTKNRPKLSLMAMRMLDNVQDTECQSEDIKSGSIENSKAVTAMSYLSDSDIDVNLGNQNIAFCEVKDSVNNTETINTLATKILAFESEGERTRNLLAYESSVDKPEHQFITKELYNSNIEVALEGSTGFSKANVTQVQFRESMLPPLANGDKPINGYGQQTVHLEHNQPISIGFALNKRLSPKISLESGIVYTYLYSKAKSMTDSNLKLRDSQTFHYFGIPLSINYKLGEWKKLQFYLSAGGMIQKDFSGRINTVQSITDLKDSRELIKKNVSQSHPQFSLTGSIGLSYPIYNNFSLYSNFGGAYYIDAHNYYETIYSDRKWIFNLNLGVKLGF